MRPALLNPLFIEATKLKGVGPAMHDALKRLLLPGDSDQPVRLRDMLFLLPSGVIDRRASPPLMRAPDGQVGTWVLQVEKHDAPSRYASKPYKVWCTHEQGGHLTLIYFNVKGDYLLRQLPVGESRVVSGKFERSERGWQIVHPDIVAPLEDLEKVKRVEPVYPLVAGLSNRVLVKMIAQVLEKVPNFPEWQEEEYFRQRKWVNWKLALESAHHPQTPGELEPLSLPRSRLAYDELLANQLALGLARSQMKRQSGRVVKGNGGLRRRLLDALPFKLTQGQKEVLKEINEDMASGQRMLRLLQGDVGSGKTIVALFAILNAVECGLQGALMAPTEILARQHLAVLQKLCEPLGIKVALLTGSIKGKARQEILEGVAQGSISLLIGTHALFQEEVTFNDLAITVVDEQHRFGVSQRMALSAKGRVPHLLHMTATPIPRSLVMTAFGDMDSSRLSEKPVGRQPIDTRTVTLARSDEVIERLRHALAKGERAYWICPLVEEKEEELSKSDLAAAEARYALFEKIFGARVGLVHGRMKADKRAPVMDAFKRGDIDLLVATTVVEVGVDVPEATIMVIEHAERFGLSQLHQLRGRIGRGSKPSTCILLYDEKCGEIGKQRLRIIRETEDGFRIAEEDLKLRGAGDVLGTKQSGLPDFHFADLGVHSELLAAARDDVKLILHRDAELSTPRGNALRHLLYLFGYDESLKFLRS